MNSPAGGILDIGYPVVDDDDVVRLRLTPRSNERAHSMNDSPSGVDWCRI